MSTIALTIFVIGEMVNRENETGCPDRCVRCGSDVVTTRGPGRTALFCGVTVAAPEPMQLARCRGCAAAYPTPAQAEELHAVADRDFISDGGRGYRPVPRGT